MAVEVIEDRAATLEFFPDRAAPASATAEFYSPGGSSLATPSVTVQSIGAAGVVTVSSVDTQTTLKVDNLTGISAGDRLYYSSDRGWSGPVLVSEVYTSGSDKIVELESPPPGVARAGDQLRGLKLSTPLTAENTADRDMNYRVEYVVTDAGGTVRHYQQIVHVVRMQFSPDRICSPTDAARYLAGMVPSYASAIGGGHFDELARRAAGRVLRLLRATGHYPHLVGDPDAFTDAGVLALRIECALTDGLVPSGYDPALYIEQQEQSLARLVRETVANMWVDKNDDGAVDEAREITKLYTIDAVRN